MSVKVLIVEDNPVARSFLSRVVKESFFDVSTIIEASDAEIARNLLNQQQPTLSQDDRFKLILVDLELPDDSGLALLRDLAIYPATRVVTTLYSDDEHLFPALQYGADGYLLKEDRFEVLVEELQKIVRGQPPLSPAIARCLLQYFRQGQVHLEDPDLDMASVKPFRIDREDPRFQAPAEYEKLTLRESEVLTYLSKGFTIKEISNLMGIKWFAVNDNIKSIYKKLNSFNKALV